MNIIKYISSCIEAAQPLAKRFRLDYVAKAGTLGVLGCLFLFHVWAFHRQIPEGSEGKRPGKPMLIANVPWRPVVSISTWRTLGRQLSSSCTLT